MPFDLLILPLVGGFFFSKKSHLTRYKLPKLDGHRLIFYSALPAIFFLLISAFITYVLSDNFPTFVWWWKGIVPFKYSGSTFISLLLGLSLPYLTNPFFNYKHYFRKMIQEHGSSLDVFLDDSINQSKIISITLKNDKVYIGKLTKIYSPIGAEDKYITLLPIFSGYRHSDTRTLELTTSYLSIFEKISENDEALGELTIDDFQIIISVDELISTNIFDLNAYNEFFGRRQN